MNQALVSTTTYNMTIWQNWLKLHNYHVISTSFAHLHSTKELPRSGLTIAAAPLRVPPNLGHTDNRTALIADRVSVGGNAPCGFAVPNHALIATAHHAVPIGQ